MAGQVAKELVGHLPNALYAVVGIAFSPVQPWAALVLTVALVRLVRGARAVTSGQVS